MLKDRDLIRDLTSPEDIAALYKRTLANAGFVVHHAFSRRFSRDGFFAIRRRPIKQFDVYDVTTAILVCVVQTRRKGTQHQAHVRIWRIDFEHPEALQVLNTAQLILPAIEYVRIMPRTLNNWRSARKSGAWKAIYWWELAQLSAHEIKQHARYSDLYMNTTT
jgi:hypothetical protein